MKPIEPFTSKSWPSILSSLGIEEKIEEKGYWIPSSGSISNRIPLSDEDNRKLSICFRDRTVIGKNLFEVINSHLYTLDEKIKIITFYHQLQSEFDLLNKNRRDGSE